MDPTYSWNTKLAHTPFPKKINTPSTTLRFIGFVAKISVLNPQLPADGQCPKAPGGHNSQGPNRLLRSPLDRTKKEQSVFCSLALFLIDFISTVKYIVIYWWGEKVLSLNKNKRIFNKPYRSSRGHNNQGPIPLIPFW